MIEEGNEHMKEIFWVILGAALFLVGFVILFSLFSADNALKVTSVLVGVGSAIGLALRKLYFANK